MQSGLISEQDTRSNGYAAATTTTAPSGGSADPPRIIMETEAHRIELSQRDLLLIVLVAAVASDLLLTATQLLKS